MFMLEKLYPALYLVLYINIRPQHIRHPLGSNPINPDQSRSRVQNYRT